MSATTSNIDDRADNLIRDWLVAARRGSREARGRLLEAFRTYLLVVANREMPADLRTKEGASDLVQETFLDGHRDFPLFKGETEAELLAWLRSILRHKLAKFERRYRQTAKRRIACERPSDSPRRCDEGDVPVAAPTRSPSWYAIAEEEDEALQGAIALLKGDYGRVIILVHRDNLSFAETARVMNRSVDATRRLWSRAVRLLAGELEAADECR